MTAKFSEKNYPIDISFEIPAGEYIMKNQPGNGIRLTPWNSSTTPHSVSIYYHFDGENEKAHYISLEGEYSNLESNSTGIRVKNVITLPITIPKEKVDLIIDKVSTFTVVNEKGKYINTESGYLKLGDKTIFTQTNPAGSWQTFSPTTWYHDVPLAATNIKLLKTELLDGDIIQILGYSAIIGSL